MEELNKYKWINEESNYKWKIFVCNLIQEIDLSKDLICEVEINQSYYKSLNYNVKRLRKIVAWCVEHPTTISYHLKDKNILGRFSKKQLKCLRDYVDITNLSWSSKFPIQFLVQNSTKLAWPFIKIWYQESIDYIGAAEGAEKCKLLNEFLRQSVVPYRLSQFSKSFTNVILVILNQAKVEQVEKTLDEYITCFEQMLNKKPKDFTLLNCPLLNSKQRCELQNIWTNEHFKIFCRTIFISVFTDKKWIINHTDLNICTCDEICRNCPNDQENEYYEVESNTSDLIRSKNKNVKSVKAKYIEADKFKDSDVSSVNGIMDIQCIRTSKAASNALKNFICIIMRNKLERFIKTRHEKETHEFSRADIIIQDLLKSLNIYSFNGNKNDSDILKDCTIFLNSLFNFVVPCEEQSSTTKKDKHLNNPVKNKYKVLSAVSESEKINGFNKSDVDNKVIEHAKNKSRMMEDKKIHNLSPKLNDRFGQPKQTEFTDKITKSCHQREKIAKYQSQKRSRESDFDCGKQLKRICTKRNLIAAHSLAEVPSKTEKVPQETRKSDEFHGFRHVKKNRPDLPSSQQQLLNKIIEKFENDKKRDIDLTVNRINDDNQNEKNATINDQKVNKHIIMDQKNRKRKILIAKENTLEECLSKIRKVDSSSTLNTKYDNI